MELLLVLVIMSLLMTLVPSLLKNALPTVTIKAAANDLVHDLKYVRNMAILKGQQTSVLINVLEGSYFSEHKDNGKHHRLPEGINISVNDAYLQDDSAESRRIGFFADGSSSGGVITLRTNESIYRVVIDWVTGRVSLQKGLPNEGM
jgi:general secretion pathway protein H